MVEANENLVYSSIPDLKNRWQKSRLAVIADESVFFQKIHELSESEFDDILKKIFLNSRNLGRGYQKQFQISWELTDISKYFMALGVPCISGQWKSKSNAIILSRAGCDSVRSNSITPHRICQYWRESIDGLVMGLCDHERYARHQCKYINTNAVGDSKIYNQLCEDVFYREEEKDYFQWSSLPQEMQPALQQLQEKFHHLKVKLTFLGLAENQLFYRLESGEVSSCGTAGTLFKDLLTNNIKKIFPELTLKDASPIAVISEAGG